MIILAFISLIPRRYTSGKVNPLYIHLERDQRESGQIPKKEMNMEERLCDAAFSGDTETLNRLLEQDPLVLDKAILKCSDKTPLHIAATLGHVEFVTTILDASSDMCFSRDRDGSNPLHLAAIKGEGNVLKLLIQKRPLAAREKTHDGGTILHSCVKNNKLEALKILLGMIKDSDFLNAKNDEGMTILHLAVLDPQIEIVICLVENNIIDVNAKNANGKTALGILCKDVPEIAKILQDAGALNVEDSDQPSNGHIIHIKAIEWLDRQRDAIMIVATLIATFAFQAGLNPAGGVWQDDLLADQYPPGNAPPPRRTHSAGEAIMAHYHPKYYRNFVRANTIAFVSSLSTILLLISGLPFRRKFFMWCLMVIMWLTITSVALTYGISIMMVTPKHYRKTLSHVIETAVTVWCFVMSLLLLGNTIRLIKRWIKGGGIKKLRSRSGQCSAVRDVSKDKEEVGLQRIRRMA